MPSEKQRREAARRHLERQTQRRRQRDVRHRKITLIASIAGAVVLIGAIVTALTFLGGGSDHPQAAGDITPPAPFTTPAHVTQNPNATAPPQGLPPTPIPAATGTPVTFAGVTVTGAKDLAGQPSIASTGKHPPSHLEFKDLVVGHGARATPKSTVTVQYIGALYKNGTVFNNTYATNASSFALDNTVPGFTRGIGGGKHIPPMRIGGRRLLVLPPSLGYGASPPRGSKIPKNAALIFLIDLKQSASG